MCKIIKYQVLPTHICRVFCVLHCLADIWWFVLIRVDRSYASSLVSIYVLLPAMTYIAKSVQYVFDLRTGPGKTGWWGSDQEAPETWISARGHYRAVEERKFAFVTARPADSLLGCMIETLWFFGSISAQVKRWWLAFLLYVISAFTVLHQRLRLLLQLTVLLVVLCLEASKKMLGSSFSRKKGASRMTLTVHGTISAIYLA